MRRVCFLKKGPGGRSPLRVQVSTEARQTIHARVKATFISADSTAVGAVGGGEGSVKRTECSETAGSLVASLLVS